MTESMRLQIGTMLAGVMGIFLLMIFAACILAIIAEWKAFKKAGQPGWAAVIPFYNIYVLTKITWGNGWLFLLTFLPIGNIVFLILTYIKLARVFGRGDGFAVGLIFLPYIFFLILAFGGSLYQGPDQKSNKGSVIACVIVGVIGVLLLGVVFVAAAKMTISQLRDMPAYVQKQPEGNDDAGDDTNVYNEDEYEADGSAGIATAEKTPIEGSEYFVNVVLDNGEGDQVRVPVLDDKYMSVIGTAASSSAEGITTSLYMVYAQSDVSEMVSDAVSAQRETLETLTEYYSDITVDEMIIGDGYALQQINYNYITWEGDLRPCFKIMKCDLQGDYAIMLELTLDNSAATEETTAVFEEACSLYGVDFQFE